LKIKETDTYDTKKCRGKYQKKNVDKKGCVYKKAVWILVKQRKKGWELVLFVFHKQEFKKILWKSKSSGRDQPLFNRIKKQEITGISKVINSFFRHFQSLIKTCLKEIISFLLFLF